MLTVSCFFLWVCVYVSDAEGNGDSISAAVQAERIALLTSALNNHNQAQTQASSPQPHLLRSQSLTPPQRLQGSASGSSYVDISLPQVVRPSQHQQYTRPQQQHVHRSQSHFELGAQYANCQPIYQTSAPRQPPFLAAPSQQQGHAHAAEPAPLLPSFLQDIVASPTLSPASTSPSSAELSIDDYDHEYSEYREYGAYDVRRVPRSGGTGSLADLGISSIWKLGGDEKTGLSATAAAFAMPRRVESS